MGEAMDEQISLLEPRSGLAETGKPSSLDLVLALNLDTVSLIYKTEMQPGEIRAWQVCLKDQPPKIVAEAFTEYLKDGTYPPKPSDILAIVANKREAAELPKFVPCKEYNFGWKYQMKEGKSTGRVVACDCRTRWVEENRK